MYLNKLLFHPPSSKSTIQSLQGKIIWIPKEVPKKKLPNIKEKKSRSADKHKNKHDRTDQSPSFKKSIPITPEKSVFSNHAPTMLENRQEEEKKLEVAVQKGPKKEQRLSIDSPGRRRNRGSFLSEGLPGDEEVDPIVESDEDIRAKRNDQSNRKGNIIDLEAFPKQLDHKDDEKKKHKEKGICFPFLHSNKKKFDIDDHGDNVPVRMGDIGALTLEKIEELKDQVGKNFVHDSSSESDEEIDPLDFKIIYIPNLILLSKFPSKKLLIYFHANNEDLSSVCEFLDRLQSTFMVTNYLRRPSLNF